MTPYTFTNEATSTRALPSIQYVESSRSNRNDLLLAAWSLGSLTIWSLYNFVTNKNNSLALSSTSLLESHYEVGGINTWAKAPNRESQMKVHIFTR